MQEILICKDICFGYDKDIVLESVNLTLKNGDFIGFVGPNGGGKSTLAKILLGILKPTSGEIIFPNVTLFNKNSNIGYTPQDTNINKNFPITALDVVLMGFLEHKSFGYKPSKMHKDSALEIMQKLGIEHLANHKIGALSGGQLQRVLIARALCGEPKLLILDEPTSNIDLPTQKEIYTLLKQININHTIIVISHDISILLECANEVFCVNRQVTSHKMLKGNFDFEGHFCEIEAINQYIKQSKR